MIPLDWTSCISDLCGVMGINDPTDVIYGRYQCHPWHLQAAFQVIHSHEQTFMASSWTQKATPVGYGTGRLKRGDKKRGFPSFPMEGVPMGAPEGEVFISLYECSSCRALPVWNVILNWQPVLEPVWATQTRNSLTLEEVTAGMLTPLCSGARGRLGRECCGQCLCKARETNTTTITSSSLTLFTSLVSNKKKKKSIF